MSVHPQPSPVVATFLRRTRLAPRQGHKLLTLWPLALRDPESEPSGLDCQLLEEALEAGTLQVDEVSEEGSVPHLLLGNAGPRAVLILFGEELRGAKQNRIANASILVPPRSELVIDVSCVEQGRWQRRCGARFEASLNVASERELGEVCGAFHSLPEQVGFVAALGQEIVGLEAIGRPELFARVFQRLLRAYAVDAADAALIEEEGTVRAPAFDAPEQFLEALLQAPLRCGPSPGLGADLRIAGEGVAGCTLEAKGLVHLTAFPEPH